MSIRPMSLVKQLVAVLLTVALLAAFVPAVGTAQAQGTAGCPILITMYDTLYVRSGPTWQSNIVATLVAGNLICLTGRNNATTWLQLSQQNGTVIGWAPANAFWTTRPVSTLPVVDGGTTPPPPTQPPPTQTTYVVQAGDTVFSIAQRFGVTIPALVAANNIGADYRIYIGQVLVIPGATTPPPPSDYVSYTVQRGDYLVKIGTQFGVDWRTIAEINNIQYPYVIYAGNVLQIPVAG